MPTFEELRGALARIRDLHGSAGECVECGPSTCYHCGHAWPCPTYVDADVSLQLPDVPPDSPMVHISGKILAEDDGHVAFGYLDADGRVRRIVVDGTAPCVSFSGIDDEAVI
jgi:hypothetical protein